MKPWPCFAAVTSGVPSARRAQTSASLATVGSASTCRLTLTSSGTARPRNGAVVVERRKRLRRAPGERAAERAAAAAQRHGQQFVAALLEPRAGEADQHAAGLDPGFELFLRAGDELADIGEHDGRDLLRDQVMHGVGDVRLRSARRRRRRARARVARNRAARAGAARPRAIRPRRCRHGAIASGHRADARRPLNARRQSRCAPPDCGFRAADRIGRGLARTLGNRESRFAERFAAAGERLDGAGARPIGAAQDARGKRAALA